MAARSAGLYWSQRITNTPVDALNEGNATPSVIYYTGANDPVHYQTPTPAHNSIHYTPGNPYTDNVTLNVGRDVASFENRWNYWRDNIRLRNGGNVFESLRSVMRSVGIKTSSAAGYQSQFGINLRIPRTPLAIGVVTHNLLADTVGVPSPSGTTVVEGSVSEAMQALVSRATQALNVNQGGYTMFLADQPAQTINAPTMVLVAKADGAPAQSPHILGICSLSKVVRDASGSGDVGLSVLTYANRYFNSQDEKIEHATAKVSVLKLPKHGRLEPHMQVGIDWREATYVPAKGFEGNDSFVLQVQGNGQTVQLNYFVYVSEDTGADMFSNKNCRGYSWKISQSNTDTSNGDLASWQRNAELSSLISAASQSLTGFQDLAGSSVGQTTGEGVDAKVTLDFTASGHGWYVDATPLDNTDDYLPTSNPNIWQAKAGTDAAGKMDMLSVLLHKKGPGSHLKTMIPLAPPPHPP